MPEGATLSDAACKALFVANVFASSCALQMFFLYRILLLPNQFETYFQEVIIIHLLNVTEPTTLYTLLESF